VFLKVIGEEKSVSMLGPGISKESRLGVAPWPTLHTNAALHGWLMIDRTLQHERAAGFRLHDGYAYRNMAILWRGLERTCGSIMDC
jgi:hypothetical protein